MTKYHCTVLFDASVNVSVEADTPEDAADQAENEAQGRQNLCHQCANELDTGDSIGVFVYNEECTEELLDTRYKPQHTWVGLTDEEQRTIVTNNRSSSGAMMDTIAKLKEKNA